MASSFLDLTGLTRFKEKLLEHVEEELTGKQDAGEYLTPEDLPVEFKSCGEVRDRDESQPTYGLI